MTDTVPPVPSAPTPPSRSVREHIRDYYSTLRTKAKPAMDFVARHKTKAAIGAGLVGMLTVGNCVDNRYEMYKKDEPYHFKAQLEAFGDKIDFYQDWYWANDSVLKVQKKNSTLVFIDYDKDRVVDEFIVEPKKGPSATFYLEGDETDETHDSAMKNATVSYNNYLKQILRANTKHIGEVVLHPMPIAEEENPKPKMAKVKQVPIVHDAGPGQ